MTHRPALPLALVALVALVAGCASPRRQLGVRIDADQFVDGARPTPPTCEHPALDHRDLPVHYWAPTGPGPYPLLVFAHGFAADPRDYAPLLGDLAAGGYVVAAPTFPVSSGGPCPERSDLLGQVGDLSAVITHVAGGRSPVSRLVDAGRIGVLGHSDGGMTAAALAHGAGLDDPRVSAVAVLSGAIPAVVGAVVPNRAPLLAVNGTADRSNLPYWAQDLYDRSQPPRARVLTVDGTHTSPYLGTDDRARATRAAVIAFFDRFLRGDGGATWRFVHASGAAGPTEADGWL